MTAPNRPSRLHGGQRRERLLLSVERDELVEVDVGDAVTVGEAEGLVVEESRTRAKAAAGHRARSPVSTSVTRHGSVRVLVHLHRRSRAGRT